jgi:hypothetical protein
MAMTIGAQRLALALLFGLIGCTSEGVIPEPRVLEPPKPLPRGDRIPRGDRTGAPALPAVAPWPEASEQTDMDARRFFLQRFGEAPRPFSSEPPPRVTAIALENTARGEAPGKRALGYLRSAVLNEGQRAVMPFSLTPKSCVSLIAQGGLGVVEVDLFLTQGTNPARANEPSAPRSGASDAGAGASRGGHLAFGAAAGRAATLIAPGGPEPTILAQDNDTGAIAVIGGRARCFEADRDGAPAAELHIIVRRGAGAVVIEGYSR